MIRYTLRCTDAHEFESWFPDSASFDEQKALNLVSCPVCGSISVDKAVMAPAVVTARRKSKAVAAQEPSAPAPAQQSPTPVSLGDDTAQKMRAMLRMMRDDLVANSRDVGPSFAEEARRMHDGVVEKEAIHGQAAPDEVRALAEDGIEVMPLPVFPDERN